MQVEYIETFEKCQFLFEFKSKIPDFERGKAKILTAPKMARDLRQAYMEYSED